jgi:signal peptidase II
MYNFKNNNRNNLAFGLIIGGIVGNLIDRIFLGYVRDFLSIQIINYYYPVFNLADSFIVIGVVLLIIAIFKGEDQYAKNKSRK